jgi:hypothetical protein
MGWRWVTDDKIGSNTMRATVYACSSRRQMCGEGKAARRRFSDDQERNSPCPQHYGNKYSKRRYKKMHADRGRLDDPSERAIGKASMALDMLGAKVPGKGHENVARGTNCLCRPGSDNVLAGYTSPGPAGRRCAWSS